MYHSLYVICVNNKKIINNIFWLFVDKILKLFFGLLVFVLLARHFGPETFGTFNFAISLYSVFLMFSSFGLSGIVVRELLKKSSINIDVLNSAFLLRVIFSLVSYSLLITVVIFLRPDDYLVQSLVFVIGFIIILQSFDVIKLWFESEVKSKPVVIIECAFFTLFSILKILFILTEMNIVFIGYLMVAEILFVSIGLYVLFLRKVGRLNFFNFDMKILKYLFYESWPLAVSTVSWVLYTRVDQLMIGQLLTDEDVGHYSAASRLSEVVNFIPMIFVFSIIPAITKLKNSDFSEYNKRFQFLYDLTVGLMMFLAIITALSSYKIIEILYGFDYLSSVSVLKIHIWSTLFIAMSAVSGRYLINEGLQKITMLRHLAGVVLNIPLNFLLIPVLGIDGAAVSSLFVLFMTCYIFDYFHFKTRICFNHKSKAIFFINTVKFLFRVRS